MKITPVITVYLGLENRDGRLVAVKADNQKHYLVLEADTYHKPEVFKDMGSTVHVEITEDAFNALRSSECEESDPFGPMPEWMFGSSVKARNALQRSGKVHPYTCGNGACRGVLCAVEGGWICDKCGYSQNLTAKP